MPLRQESIFWLGAAAAVALFLYLFHGVLLPFVAGLILGYLLDPLANRMERAGLNRLGAALLILAVFSVVFALVLIVAVPILVHQLAAFIEALPGLVTKLQTLITAESAALSEKFGGNLAEKLGFDASLSPADLQKSVGDIARQGGQWALGFLKSLWTGGQALVNLLALLVVTPVVFFYILLDWDRMIVTIDSWVPEQSRATVRQLARDMDRAIAGFLRGQSLVCLFLGLWYGIGLSLIGLNYGFLIGISAGVLSFIPYVGSLSALVLSAIVAIVQGWPSWSLFFMAMAVVGAGQFLEGNILTPKLVGGSVGLHPVWLMFALFAFGSLFGFTGLVLAVPVAAAIGVLCRHGLRRYLESPYYKGRPAEFGKGD
jgi:predicted PurR-regulated permease PerM